MADFGLVSLLLWSCIIINAASLAQAQTTTVSKLAKTDPLKTVLLQGFNWDSSNSASWYNVLKGIVNDAAEAGITDVWFPPPSQSSSSAPQGYMPMRLYDLNSSKYGSEQELLEAVDAFHQKGIGCVGDMVLNHRCGVNGCENQCGEKWCEFEGGTADGRLDWGSWAVVPNDEPKCGCGTGHNDSGDGFYLSPDIDHTNPQVQADLSEWMNWLKSHVGFDGWRFDFSLGYAASILGNYVKNTNPEFAVGEVWDSLDMYSNCSLLYDQDAHRQRIVNWVHSTGDRASAFDITTKFILLQAVTSNELWRLKDSNGRPAGMIGVLPQKSVTFVDNHDTARPPDETVKCNKRRFPYDKLGQAYAYILTHPGVPSIFYDDFQEIDIRTQIRNLTAIRMRNNINANSSCRIITAESDLYMAAIDEKIVMKIGARGDLGNFNPDSSNFSIATAGIDYAVWEKKSSSG